MADETRTPSAAGFAAQRATVVSCWLCGIGLLRNQMVPDGGSDCSDVRWYEPPRVRWRLRCFGFRDNYSVTIAG